MTLLLICNILLCIFAILAVYYIAHLTDKNANLAKELQKCKEEFYDLALENKQTYLELMRLKRGYQRVIKVGKASLTVMKEVLKEAHPDNGGNTNDFQKCSEIYGQLKQAMEEL